MAKKAKARKSAKKGSAKKAKKAVKKGVAQRAMMTVKIPVGTAEDPHPPYKIPVPVAPGEPPQWIYCEWDNEKNRYVCQ